MNRLLSATLIAVLGLGLAAGDADARRLGGGGGAGMKRSVPAQQPQRPADAPTQNTAPTSPAAPQQGVAPRNAATPAAAGAAAAQAPRRSWLGPVAGIAAGLGLAALFSHLGLGAAVAEFVTLLLLVIVAVFLIRFVMRRLRPQDRLAPAGAAAAGGLGSLSARQPLRASEPVHTGAPSPMAGGSAAALPGFDTTAFAQVAKQIFVRMQAANDAADLAALRQFTTPQMLQAIEHDLRERGQRAQRTDVVQLAAEVIDTGREDGRDVVSVRYQGLIREEEGDVAQPFDEVWHLVRSDDGGWLLAGIQSGA